MHALNYPLIVGPFVQEDTDKLQMLLDAAFEFVTGQENSYYPAADYHEQHRRLDLAVRNKDFFVLSYRDRHVSTEIAERVAKILRDAYWT